MPLLTYSRIDTIYKLLGIWERTVTRENQAVTPAKAGVQSAIQDTLRQTASLRV